MKRLITPAAFALAAIVGGSTITTEQASAQGFYGHDRGFGSGVYDRGMADRSAGRDWGPGGGYSNPGRSQWGDNVYQVVPDRLADALYPEDWPERQLSGTYRGLYADDLARRYGYTQRSLGFAEQRASDRGAFDRAAGRDQGPGGGGYGGGRSSGGDRDWYVVIPDYFPETPAYRGLQDYVLLPDYSQSMEWLSKAAQGLREAIQAMAQQPESERRNQAIDKAQEALLTTQAAMVQLPPEMRTR